MYGVHLVVRVYLFALIPLQSRMMFLHYAEYFEAYLRQSPIDMNLQWLDTNTSQIQLALKE